MHNPEDFVRFIDSVGCCMRLPMPKYPDFPNQREVIGKVDPDAPDQWFWKDDLHAEKRIYYTRVFGGQPGYLSYSQLPAFIAANGAVVDELLYEGLMTVEAQQLYTAIEQYGPIPIKELKRMLTPDARRAATKNLHGLERRFIITKTGITGRTMGTYGYIWDLLERWAPEMLAAADKIGRECGMTRIREHLARYGIPTDSAFYQKVLGWQG